MNRSYQDKGFADKAPHYAKQNLFAASLTDSAYAQQPQFSQFVKGANLPFQPYDKFGRAEQAERAELVLDLCRLVWSPDRLDHQPLSPRPPTRSTGRQLSEPLADDTVIPAGQRSSRAIRAYLSSRVGPGFRFDAAMRDFVTHGEGRTLGEAVEHWRATRSAQRPAIGPQFELNRFGRAWHRAHPGGSRADLLAAWSSYRSLPVDARTAPDTAR